MKGLKISKMQVIDNPREDAQIPIVQNGTNYSMPFGTLNKLITQIYEDYDIPNALQQLQIQIDSADAATAKAKDKMEMAKMARGAIRASLLRRC